MRPDISPGSRGFRSSQRSAQQGFTSSRRSAQQGFTLVEVLVALVVTSLILAIVMNASLQAKARSVAALDKEEALILARGLIADRSVSPFDAAPRAGTSGRLVWRVEEEAIAGDQTRQFLLASIRVSVRNPSGASLAALEARKIKAVPAS
ncbi:MAG TPA: prepilin-type N-terminal cleavage/methylation domain-containing protein [Allosphingosinicella sp.]|nr:prepilin-type N-terminal cleavage/methylation domain-containing protein [Allosphingosinicella sp.]